MLLDIFEDFFLWTIYFVSYNFKKEQYENKILNKLNIICYVLWGSMQLILILVFLIMLKLFYSSPPIITENLLSVFAGVGILCFILIYIKQVWLFFSIQKPLFLVVDKKNFSSKLIVFGLFAFIPIIGYFATMVCYFIAERKLKNNDFEVKVIFKKIK